MSLFRSCLVLIACSVGCASAREASNADGNIDAAVGGPDAAGSSHPDAGAQPDSGTSSGCAFSGVLATWSFSGQTGSQLSTPVAATATGVTASGVQRAATLTAVSGTNSINASGWPTAAARDTAKYYSLTITPPADCMIALTTAEIDAKASGTGPQTAVAATSVDAFAATVAVSTAAAGTITLNTAPTSNAVEVRIYGFSATAAGGTLRVQTALTINGTLQ